MNKLIIDGIEYKLVPILDDNIQYEYFPKKENADIDDSDLKYRIEEEGIGYTLEHYCSYGDIKNEKTRVLFGFAVKSLDKLKEHLGVE